MVKFEKNEAYIKICNLMCACVESSLRWVENNAIYDDVLYRALSHLKSDISYLTQ